MAFSNVASRLEELRAHMRAFAASERICRSRHASQDSEYATS
jgi:hypothetical protein